mgnify:FL=1
MTYADCLLLIRDRLQAPSTSTLSDAAIARTFDSAYSQWWGRFSNHVKSVTTGAMTAGVITLTNDATFSDVVSVMAGTSILARVPLSTIYWHIANASGAAGFTTAAGTAEMYALEIIPATSVSDMPDLGIHTFPTSSSTLTVRYRNEPVQGSTITTGKFECSADVLIGLCAVSALRLMPAVGKQNDSGLIQALVSEIPQEIQSMSLRGDYSDVLPTNPPEGA